MRSIIALPFGERPSSIPLNRRQFLASAVVGATAGWILERPAPERVEALFNLSLEAR